MNLPSVKSSLLEIESLLNGSMDVESGQEADRRITAALQRIRASVPADRIIAMNLVALEGRVRELVTQQDTSFAKSEILRMCARVRSVLPRTS